jgi:hypothetical protein
MPEAIPGGRQEDQPMKTVVTLAAIAGFAGNIYQSPAFQEPQAGDRTKTR